MFIGCNAYFFVGETTIFLLQVITSFFFLHRQLGFSQFFAVFKVDSYMGLYYPLLIGDYTKDFTGILWGYPNSWWWFSYDDEVLSIPKRRYYSTIQQVVEYYMLAPYENSNQVNYDIIRNNLGLYYPNLSNRIYPDDVALYIGDYIKDYGTLIIQGYPNSYIIIIWILSSDPI